MKTKLLNIVSKLGLALMLAPVAMAQQPPHLLQDNVVMQAIEPMNWHPEGKNFGFSSSRGTVTNQKGSIKPQMVGNIRVGNFSVQNASLKGVLSYDTVFDNHGHEVHGNFGSTIKSEASEKSNRNDGSQVSYSLKWTATMNHPADAYDGVQGGGYPSPTGARDEYSFDISGVAVGTYLVTEWSMDAAYKPNIDNRNQNYLKALEASQDRNSAKLDKAFNNPDRDLEWYHRVIYGFNGTLGLMASPVTGLGGFMQPEFEQASQGIYYLENKSIKDLQGKGTQQQFDAISNWAATYHDIDNASQWLAERPMIGETLEAGSWLVGGYQVAKSVGKVPVGKAITPQEEYITVYRSTNNFNEFDIFYNQTNGAILSDTAREVYNQAVREGVSVENSLQKALQVSKQAHTLQMNAWGTLDQYARAHAEFGLDMRDIGQRTLVSTTTDPRLYFGEYKFELKVKKSDVHIQTLETSTESEVLLIHGIFPK
jgi:hypothetical protein